MRQLFIAAWIVAGAAMAADQHLAIDGGVPDDEARYFEIPFTVPAGIQEIEVRHDDLSGSNILDWGLEDPNGFRGWGGGNEEPAVVGVQAASRSYLTGAILPGEWKVVVGKAKIASRPARFEVDIHLRESPTLPAQTRNPYTPSPPLENTARWYAGDFHVHSEQSGDARPPLDEIATFSRAAGLDFVLLSDHNTISTLDFISDAQRRHPQLLLIPGMEYTTYRGHANAIGSTVFADSRVGYQGRTLEEAVDAFHADGALFSINHPVMDLPAEMCIGCAWEQPVPPNIDAVEIATTGWQAMNVFFSEPTLAFWDSLSARGIHAKALGGSDDHRAGVDLNDTQSAIGAPTTMVFADELSVAGIVQGIRNGRTVVKLQGPDDPMVELDAPGRVGDTVIADQVHLTAVLTEATGHTARFVRNGRPLGELRIDADPFRLEHHALPGDTADRYRVEVLVGGRARTITSNLWVQKTAGAAPSPHELEAAESCACGGAPGFVPVLAALTGLFLVRGRRGMLGGPGD